jgi:DNA-binding response OmpR family regulator
VEDDWAIGMDLEGIVSSVGHRTLGPVATADEAMEIAQAFRPDLVLLVVRLSDRASGVVVARELKHQWAIPAIFVSASREQTDAHRDLRD